MTKKRRACTFGQNTDLLLEYLLSDLVQVPVWNSVVESVDYLQVTVCILSDDPMFYSGCDDFVVTVSKPQTQSMVISNIVLSCLP